MDKWELLETELNKLNQEIVQSVKENGHVGQATRIEKRLMNRVLHIVQQVQAAEQNFYDTASGTGG
jgi:hypothetical protein